MDEEHRRVVLGGEVDGGDAVNPSLIHFGKGSAGLVAKELAIGGMPVVDLAEEAPVGGTGEADGTGDTGGFPLDEIRTTFFSADFISKFSYFLNA